ncbi:MULTISPECIES: DUF4625 domain-containing protein [unclassified Cellulophaga]|uniref:DUF4625 domain-containing protein n=1 Tax=unclassified Cellulophaga TaxID=2634405 RepID=UPI0026E312DD|nr:MULTISPECIES: DUF4625 domain-containing protein [unclassified Cellulophaga]MDO6491023.1 DUF4625 domain-containing protein [Cellulophaga sp. 2_MG-2023]MDO6493783.1 DUF4625 domain-containing protein [Cellulophaga sp. 3_MG-2023]
MKIKLKYFFFLPLLAIISSCSSDDSSDKDEEKPTISINYTQGFPQPCVQLVKGETYSFRAQVTDNKALASYSLDIHNNFDHHTHDDQEGECNLDPIKDPVNPFIYMENFTVPEGSTSYEINVSLTIPDDIDTGDYHCAYSVTDQTGWQSRTSIDIKIVD